MANVITGNAGANLIDGGAGADRMIGGDGGDIYIVDNAGDRITELGTGTGVDSVKASITTKLAANVEVLMLTGNGAINGTGNGLVNTIFGNDAANVLDGGVISDFGGYDTLAGGKGDDTYVFSQNYATIEENAGEGIDTLVSGLTIDSLAEDVENLVLTGIEATTGGGNALDNRITGNAMGNFLQGFDGNDTLSGGIGNDTLYGGAGDDVLLGGAGSDFLFGNTGTNTLKGGGGNDNYYLGEGTDTVAEKAGEGDGDIIYSTISITAPQNVELIFLSGNGAINAAGNAQANALYGSAGINLLNGLGGDDVLGDFGYNDTLTGGTGADVFMFSAQLNGGTSTVSDFKAAEKDVIRLSAIDANAFTGERDAFKFIGTAAFSGVFGQLRYEQIGGNTFVSGDVNGDLVADFTIKLMGLMTLTLSDFQLTL